MIEKPEESQHKPDFHIVIESDENQPSMRDQEEPSSSSIFNTENSQMISRSSHQPDLSFQNDRAISAMKHEGPADWQMQRNNNQHGVNV